MTLTEMDERVAEARIRVVHAAKAWANEPDDFGAIMLKHFVNELLIHEETLAKLLDDARETYGANAES